MINNLSQFPVTLIEILDIRAQNQPDKLAYTFLKDGEIEEDSITYARLEQRARAVGAKLHDLIAPGERVLLLFPSGIDYIAAFFGCIYAGAIAIPAYPPRRKQFDQRLQVIIADAQAKVVLTTSEVIANLAHYLVQTPELQELQWIAIDTFTTQDILHWSALWQAPKVLPETLAFLQYTSGSTGHPKGVMVSHGNVIHNSAYMKRIWNCSSDSVMVTWLPIFHDMGLIFGILQPLYSGFSCYLMSPTAFVQRPLRWLQAISHYQATHSGAPNFAYELCLNKINEEQRATLDLSHWEMSINGAEPARAETFTHFYEYFKSTGLRPTTVCHGYGMAEATLAISSVKRFESPIYYTIQSDILEQQHRVVAATAAGQDTHTFVGCGYPDTDAKVVIVDPITLEQCQPDQVGEIWISSPSVAGGYWQKPIENIETFQAYLKDSSVGPFLRTGDLGFLYEGELFITGRLKDLMIIHGENYYPQDIESTAEKSHVALRQGYGAAFSVEVGGEERLVVVQEVERTYLKKVDTGEVISSICQAIAEQHELPVYSVVLLKPATVPKTSSGKIQRQACKSDFLAGNLSTLAVWQHPGVEQLDKLVTEPETVPVTSKTPLQYLEHAAPEEYYQLILTTTRKLLLAITGFHHINDDDNLIENGVDSLSLVELQEQLSKTYHLNISTTFLREYPTLRQVANHLRQRLQPADAMGTELSFVAEDKMTDKLKNLADFSYRLASELTGRRAKIDGQWYIDYGSCNYLGFDWHPHIINSVQPALERWGVHPPWTRFLASPQIYQDLENKLMELMEAPYVDVFPTVTLLNMGLMPELVGAEDVVFIDQYAHNCLQMAAALCHERGTRIVIFRHNDVNDLAQRLAKISQPCKKLIVVDGIYSLDGTHAPLPELVKLGKRYQALIMIDDSHGFGILGEHPTVDLPYGKRGNGIVKYYDLDYGRDGIIYVGQLSKAYSTMGGFVAYGDPAIQIAVRNAFSMIFSGPLPTASLATGIAGLEVNETEGDVARATLLERTRSLTRGLIELGYEIASPTDSHNIRVNLGAQPVSIEFLKNLMIDERIIVTPAIYPAVEWTNTGFRFMVTALHTEEDIAETLASMKKLVNIVKPTTQAQKSKSSALEL